MKQVSLRLDDALAAELDVVRGSVPRERWIRNLIEHELGCDLESTVRETVERNAGGKFSPQDRIAVESVVAEIVTEPQRTPTARRVQSAAPSAPALPRAPDIRGYIVDATTGERVNVVAGPTVTTEDLRSDPPQPSKQDLDAVRQQRLNEARELARRQR